MSISNFVDIVKKELYTHRTNDKLPEESKEIIFKAYLELKEEDQRTIAFMVLSDIKNCHHNPLTPKHIADIKYINSKEMIKLRSFVIKTLVISTAAVIGSVAIFFIFIHVLTIIQEHGGFMKYLNTVIKALS